MVSEVAASVNKNTILRINVSTLPTYMASDKTNRTPDYRRQRRGQRLKSEFADTRSDGYDGPGLEMNTVGRLAAVAVVLAMVVAAADNSDRNGDVKTAIHNLYSVIKDDGVGRNGWIVDDLTAAKVKYVINNLRRLIDDDAITAVGPLARHDHRAKDKGAKIVAEMVAMGTGSTVEASNDEQPDLAINPLEWSFIEMLGQLNRSNRTTTKRSTTPPSTATRRTFSITAARKCRPRKRVTSTKRHGGLLSIFKSKMSNKSLVTTGSDR